MYKNLSLFKENLSEKLKPANCLSENESFFRSDSIAGITGPTTISVLLCGFYNIFGAQGHRTAAKTRVDIIEVVTSPSSNFRSVGRYYQDFSAVTDEQVIEIMKRRTSLLCAGSKFSVGFI